MELSIQSIGSDLQSGLSDISETAIGAGIGVIGSAIVGSAVTGGILSSSSKSKSRRKKRKNKSKNSRKKSPKRRSRPRYPRTAGKRKDTSHRRIRMTKNGQPYIIQANGRARFISKASARRSRKLKGGRY